MSRVCAGCGEELLGAVNRCWKCGRIITAPENSQGDFDSESGVPTAFASQSNPQPPDMLHDAAHDFGSLAPRQSQVAALTLPDGNTPTTDERTIVSAALGGLYGAIVMAILALIGLFVAPLAALVTAILGIGLALWGLYSPRRGLASLIAIVCLLLLMVAISLVAVDLFVVIYGYGPFAPSAEPDMDQL